MALVPGRRVLEYAFLFHAGPRIFHPTDRMLALPICTLRGEHH